MKRIVKLVAVLLCLGMLFAGCAAGNSAEKYPAKNIEIICPYSAGGGSDLFSRGVAEVFNQIFDVTTLVTNKTGGNGQIGAAYVKNRKDDPYTIMSANSGDIGGWMDAEIDYFDFDPIAIIAYDVNILVVNANSPYQTMQDLIDASLADPKSVVFGGTIIGSNDQILCQLLMNETGIKSEYVPFEGGGEVSSALLGGHITASFINPSEASAQVEAGKLRALAVAAKERLSTMADIPTTVECGFETVTFAQFRGLVADKGTDPIIIDKLTKAMEQVSKSETFMQYATNKHWVVIYENPDQMKKVIEEQDAIVRQALGKEAVAAYTW